MLVMKSSEAMKLKLQPFSSKPIFIFRFLQLRNEASLSFSSSSSTSADSSVQPKPKNATLTQKELTKINLLIPRLCLSDHLSTAIQLTTTALLTNPPPKSLPLSILIHSLTSQPDLTQPMSLLNRLKHTPPVHHYLTPIANMLIASYLRMGRPKEALKVYKWMMRPGSPCEVESIVYGNLVHGLCKNSLVSEALKILRNMVGANMAPGVSLRKRVSRSLLREARVKEAMELDKALGCVEERRGEGSQKALGVLDHIIGNWTE